MLKNLLQRVFNFGLHDDKKKAEDIASKEERLQVFQRKTGALSECQSLLREAREQRIEKRNSEALATFESIVDILEREGL